MKHITEIVVDAPAAAAWTVLGERFGALAEWSSGIDESHLEGVLGVGARRICRSSTAFGPFPPSVVTERLIHFDPATRAFAYDAISGLPPVLRRATNHWRIDADGPDRCRIISEAELRFAWWALPLAPLFPLMLRRAMQGFTVELTAAVEAEAHGMCLTERAA